MASIASRRSANSKAAMGQQNAPLSPQQEKPMEISLLDKQPMETVSIVAPTQPEGEDNIDSSGESTPKNNKKNKNKRPDQSEPPQNNVSSGFVEE